MPDRSRSTRRKDALLLGGYTVILFVVTLPIVSMMDSAWTPNALSFNLIHALTDALGTDIDVAVVFPVGICLGWLTLFLLDRSKRIQAVILAITGGGFVFILTRFGRWTTTVDWGEHIGILVIGFLIAVITGLAGAFSKRSVREFPTAAAGLYVVATLVTVISFFEVHLSYQSPIDAGPNRSAPPIDSALIVVDGLLVNAVSAVLFVVILATFVQYDYRKDVILIAPSAVSETVVLAGLFDTIRNRKDGHSVEKDFATRLSDAVGSIHSGRDPAPIEADVSLKFKRPGAHSLWIEIGSEGSLAKHLGSPPFERLRKRHRRSFLEYFRRMVIRALTTAFPFNLTTLASDQRRLIERIDTADVVVLIAQTRDALGDEATYVEAYREIDDIYKRDRSKRIVIGALDPEAAFDDFEADRGVEPDLNKSSFEDYLQRSVFEVRCKVIPLSTVTEDEPVEGSKNLLSLIEQ